MPTATKQTAAKRIHKVTIKRMVDNSPDTSWLGEYSNKQTSEYSIDRAHSLGCPVNTGTIVVSDDPDCTCVTRSWYGEEHDTACALEGPRDSDGNEPVTDADRERFSTGDWQYDVSNGNTKLGYEDWVRHNVEAIH